MNLKQVREVYYVQYETDILYKNWKIQLIRKYWKYFEPFFIYFV